MRTYLDSSALVPVYVNERFSRAARSVVRTAGQIPFTAIHQLEIPNAFELLVGRKLITRDECLALQAQLQDDLDNQRLMPVSLELVSFAKIAMVMGQIAVTPSADVARTIPGIDGRSIAIARFAGAGQHVLRRASDRQHTSGCASLVAMV